MQIVSGDNMHEVSICTKCQLKPIFSKKKKWKKYFKKLPAKIFTQNAKC